MQEHSTLIFNSVNIATRPTRRERSCRDTGFLAADVEGIEGIRAVGAVFEQVFFALGKFLAGFVFAIAVAPSADSCRLDGEDKVFVVGAVEEGHEALLAGEALIDDRYFFLKSPVCQNLYSNLPYFTFYS